MGKQNPRAEKAASEETQAPTGPTPFSQLPHGQAFTYNGANLRKVGARQCAELHDDSIVYPMAAETVVDPAAEKPPEDTRPKDDPPLSTRPGFQAQTAGHVSSAPLSSTAPADEAGPTNTEIRAMKKAELVALAASREIDTDGMTAESLREELLAPE